MNKGTIFIYSYIPLNSFEFILQDLQHLLSCCFRRKQTNELSHLTFKDPLNYYIYLGINTLKVSKSQRLLIIDYGSSYGEKSIETMKIILDYLVKTHKLSESPLIIHNDILTNNWTRFFQIHSTNTFYSSLALARSFYEQCLPNNSLSIGYSSASLHYLSRKPCNITKHCYIHFATEHEKQSFQEQSKFDWNLFLKYRSQELISGGILILNIPSRNDDDNQSFNHYFDLIYQCAQIIFPNELINFTLPFYLRHLSECFDLDLFTRHSFRLIKIDLIRTKSRIFDQYQQKQITYEQFIKSLIILMQSAVEIILRQTLEYAQRTSEEIEQILTKFWSLYEEKLRNEKHNDDIYTYSIYLILQKI